MLIAVAASGAEAVTQVGKGFTRETGIPIAVNAAASSFLAQQIAAGMPAALFLSANPEWVDNLEQRNLVSRRCDLLGNSLVAIAPAGTPEPLADAGALLSDTIKHISIGDPEAVPAGRYAKQALSALGLWHTLLPKIVPCMDVRQALIYVERGDAEAGIVYATDAAITQKVRILFTLDDFLDTPVRYPLALLSGAGETAGAQRFFDYLRSPAAGRIFMEHGFTCPGDTP